MLSGGAKVSSYVLRPKEAQEVYIFHLLFEFKKLVLDSSVRP